MSISSYKNEKSKKSAWRSMQSIPDETYTSCNELDDLDTELKTKIFNDNEENPQNINKNGQNGFAKENIYNTEMTVKIEKRTNICKRFFNYIINLFDLTLLKDPIYLNMMLGMSLAIFAELNFSLFTPFILNDLQMKTSEIANFLSVLSVMDIIFRFLAPFIGDYMNQPPRVMYGFSLILLILTRFCKYHYFV